MNKPLVAIVGRPNVGKSTLFNKLAGKRISIVEDMPGVTRDRLYYDTEWCGYNFTMVDTGGLEVKSEDQMWMHIRTQVEAAVELCDTIIFLVDGKNGLVSDDYDIADFLRVSKKSVILAVNKLDNNEVDLTYEFYALGLGEPYCISAEQGKGLGEVLDAVVEQLEKIDTPSLEDEEVVNIAVVGRPNAGKSSTVNRLLGYDRVIVSDIAGTTRDAIDTAFTHKGKKYNIIDTAGMRRKRSIDEDVEQYSVMRSLAAIRRADVVLIVIDASQELSEQDVRICGYVHEQNKPSVILMNKWDAVQKDAHTVNQYNKKLDEELKYMSYYQVLYVSAKTGQREDKIMDAVELVYSESSKRITTGTLNDIIQDAVSVVEPPTKNGKRLKVLFATQSSVRPPTFIFFVNDATLVHFSYKRYLENVLRKTFEFKGTPILLVFRNKDEKEIY